MSENIGPDFLNERVEKITAQNAALEERRRVARQITDRTLADAAVDQASKERAIGTEIFLLEQKRNVSQEIVKAKLSDAELERIHLEGDRPTLSDQFTPVRPITVNPAGPNPPEKPVVQSKGWEWGKATGEGFTKRT
jgi:hypothetical protein